MRTEHATWSSFWGPLLQVRFHEGDPARWTVRQERAARIAEGTGLEPGTRVLELGCGDGVLDLCLADLGAAVTGVDRTGPVLDSARREAGDRSVSFIEADLREFESQERAWDVILFLEVSGLMSRDDDLRLLRSVARWLRPGGSLLVDAPHPPAKPSSSWSRTFDDGELHFPSSYDASTRTQRIVPVFKTVDGRTIDLVDPYDPERPDPGITRYLYEPEDLRELLTDSGFHSEHIEHWYGETHYLLRATPH